MQSKRKTSLLSFLPLCLFCSQDAIFGPSSSSVSASASSSFLSTTISAHDDSPPPSAGFAAKATENTTARDIRPAAAVVEELEKEKVVHR